LNKSKKKLIEVALPLDAINIESKKDGNMVHGHPRSLHRWFARRPLASCKAAIFASLVDDPGNTLPEKKAKKERERLFKIMEKLILWKNTGNKLVINEAIKEIKKSLGDEIPEIVDPFCGGGSIPLESCRLGIQTSASDLNPIALLISKSMLTLPQRFVNRSPINPNSLKDNTLGEKKGLGGIASDVNHYAELIKNNATKKLKHLYPQIEGKNVAAWLWTRTVKCSNPACGFDVPLVRTFQLTKKNHPCYAKPIKDKRSKTIKFEVTSGKSIEPGTVHRTYANCLNCPAKLKLEYIREEGIKKNMSYKLISIVLEEKNGLSFISPTTEHQKISEFLRPELKDDIEITYNSRYATIPAYGMKKFSDLFTTRQLTTLITFRDLILESYDVILKDAIHSGLDDDNISLEDDGKGAKAYAELIITYLTLALDKSAESWSSLCYWNDTRIGPTFARQALPMVWDFAEANPFSGSTANWSSIVQYVTKCINYSIPIKSKCTVSQIDATKALSSSSDNVIVITDPPYYDNIGYADLSDFFYMWARSVLKKIFPTLFSTIMTPKLDELAAIPQRFDGDKDAAEKHFVTGLAKTFALIKKKINPNFPVSIYYSYKEGKSGKIKEQEYENVPVSKGWETLLQSLISEGFQITGTWPMKTESVGGTKDKKNYLASSILLICRSRDENAPMAVRREFVTALKKELPTALIALQHGSISPVDLAQSTLGPGMAIYSKFSKVLEADGDQMSIKTALQIINQELEIFLNSRESDFDQETRFCLAWFEQYGFKPGEFGEANVLARAKNTSVERLMSLNLIESKNGKIRLLNSNEYLENTDLKKMVNVNIWFCTHELIRVLDQEGEKGAANVVEQIGVGLSDSGKNLAYTLFSISEKKGWTDTAFSYNSLVSSWAAIQKHIGLGQIPDGQMRL
jgi:putative DNA methylase